MPGHDEKNKTFFIIKENNRHKQTEYKSHKPQEPVQGPTPSHTRALL